MRTKKFQFQISPTVSYEVTFFLEGKEVKDITTIRTPFDASLTFAQFCKETEGIDYKKLSQQL